MADDPRKVGVYDRATTGAGSRSVVWIVAVVLVLLILAYFLLR